MSFYERHLLPYLIDLACGLPPLRRQRELTVPLAGGRVLEVGIGTGRNLAFYDRANVRELYGLDPAETMHRLARRRAARIGLQVTWLSLPAEQIPTPAASFDTLVMTYTLCSIGDPLRAVAEMRRVLRPDGRLLFCEHGRAPDEAVRRWQDRLTPIWKPLAGGCHLNRDIPGLIQSGGFRITALEARYISGPRPLAFNYRGAAISA